jgi:hypothetical protein
MRSYHLLTTSLTGLLILGGCSGGGSGLHGPEGTTSMATGGGAGQSSAGVSGKAGASGGARASGGVASSASSVASGAGARSTSILGGSTSTGGTVVSPPPPPPPPPPPAGGAIPPSSDSTATGGRSGVSSSSPIAGSSAIAGASGAGATSAGGSSRGGNASSGGSTSSSRNPDAGVGDGGIVASGYCEGNSPKLTTQGQTVTPGVTDFQANIAMDCCNGYGVNLHSTAALGFDVAIELILSLNIFTPGEYDLGGPASIKARALVFKNSEAPTSLGGVYTQGKLRVLGADGSAGMAEFSLCMEVTDTTSSLLGTKIYVPRVIIGSYQSGQRFQIYLLKDATLRSGAVSTQALDSLVLADYPVLDLDRIAYVEKATSKMGFNPGQKYGSSLRTKLGTPLDMPFVVVADGVRIYLGTFTSGISSISPTGPFVEVENITDDSLTLHAPMNGTDPRNDERIIRALSEREKLVP